MSVASRVVRAVAGGVLAAVVATAAIVFPGGGTAQAQARYGQIVDCYMNLADYGGNSQMNQYQALIESLRRAVAEGNRPVRGDVYDTQWNAEGLIRLQLTVSRTGASVYLWINPQNLYVLGYQNRYGTNFAFLQSESVLGPRLSQAGFTRVPTNLGFGASYPQLAAAANRGLDQVDINYADILGAVDHLANETNPYGNYAVTARSLQPLILFTAEAARFNDVLGLFRATTNGTSQPRGVPARQNEIINHWSALSDYGHYSSDNPTAGPLYIGPNAGYVYNWLTFAAIVAVMLTPNIRSGS